MDDQGVLPLVIGVMVTLFFRAEDEGFFIWRPFYKASHGSASFP
jgi:hypothetical protein